MTATDPSGASCVRPAINVLFVTYTYVGDAILSTGLLSHVIERHPEARITVACGARTASLFRSAPNIERIVVMHKRPLHGHWFPLWLGCVGRVWDMVIDLKNSGLAWMLPARRRYVAAKQDLHVHRVVQLGRLLGLDPPPSPKIWVSTEDEARAEALQPPGVPVLATGPTANWREKEWRAERFAELIARLTGPGGILPGARVAVHGAGDERARVRPVFDALTPDRVIDLMGVELPVAAACMRRSTLYIGNDSGPMHLAAASGLPTLGLFGPTRDTLYAPWGARTAVVRTAKTFEELFRGARHGHRNTDDLMDTLTVDAVEGAARRLLAGAAEPRALAD